MKTASPGKQHAITPVNPNLLDGPLYCKYASQFADKAEQKLSRSNTLILCGQGAQVYVRGGALTLKQGRTHIPQEESITQLYKGTHNLKQLFILSTDGFITFEALDWCRQQHVAVTLFDDDGNILTSNTEPNYQPSCRRMQYRASDTSKALQIACWLVLEKTQAQIETLQHHTNLTNAQKIGQTLQDAMAEIPTCCTIEYLRTLEGRLAKLYFSAFTDFPLHWKKRDAGIVPPHWLVIAERHSLLAPNGNGRHATNPYHAALNYAYALLEADVLRQINQAGLDPACAFLHADKAGRASLVYDIMEPYRARVDSLLLSLFSRLCFERGMFIPLENGEARLNPQLARFVVASCQIPAIEIKETVDQMVNMLFD